MATTLKNLVPLKQVENAQTTQYTAVNCTALIDSASVTNTSAGAVTFSCNLPTSGGSVGDANLVIKARSIAAGETYLCREIIGKALENGGYISTLASAAASLTLGVNGREIT